MFYFILFIFFSVILVQKQNEQLLNEELIYRDFLSGHKFSGIKKYSPGMSKNNRQIQMYDLGNCKNSVGLKPNAELRKDAKAPSAFVGAE